MRKKNKMQNKNKEPKWQGKQQFGTKLANFPINKYQIDEFYELIR